MKITKCIERLASKVFLIAFFSAQMHICMCSNEKCLSLQMISHIELINVLKLTRFNEIFFK